jgi:DNA-binding NtrC family response regulator
MCLENYSWPGNLRELHNVLHYAISTSDSQTIEISHLPEWFLEQSWKRLEVMEEQRMPDPSLGTAEVPMSLDYEDTLRRFEEDYLRRALFYCKGKVNLTARKIGINKTTLIRRIKAYGLHEEGKQFSEKKNEFENSEANEKKS